jgi:hypothetical protein
MPKLYSLTETTTEATHYYIVKPLNVAIPKTPDSIEVLNGLILNHGAYKLPSKLADYPIITRAQLTLFPACLPIEVKITYLKYKEPVLKWQMGRKAKEPRCTIPPQTVIAALKLKKVRPSA